MKHIKVLVIVFSLSLIPTIAYAQTSVPKFVNFQGVLVDEGGNVLYDIQQADVRCSVVDGAGTVLYEEIQPDTALINGAISILCGNGVNPSTGAVTGGIPYDVFSPDGSRLLRVQVNDSIPQEEVEIVSVPYAMIAERLSSDITSDIIADGTIQQVDLSADLIAYIDSQLGLSEADLTAHRTESGAHPARSITVENNFVNMPGTNLQQILSHVDTAIGIRSNQDGVLQGNINDEADTRETADDLLQTAVTTAQSTADTAVANAAAAQSTANTAVTNAAAAQSTANMALINAATAQSTANTAVTNAATAQATADSKVSKSGDAMTGDLTMGSIADINMSSGRTVDGVDVSNLRDRVVILEFLDPANVFAWANVDSNGNILGGHNISSVTEFGGSCRFDVFFDTDASGAYDTYMVTGSIIDGGTDNHVVVHSQSAGGFTISTRETNADCNEDHDFSVLVVGE